MFEIGDPGTTFYIVLEGRVRILVPFYNNETDCEDKPTVVMRE